MVTIEPEMKNTNEGVFKMSTYILALDVGTSSVKASLVSPELKVAAEAAESYPTYTPAPHCV